MADQITGAVDNTFVNLGQILKLVQIGNMHGHISIHLGDMVHTETEAVLGEYQKYLAATFSPAEPEAYQRFRKVFDDQGRGVLEGEPGNGRETTAIALHTSRGLRVHSIPLDEKPRMRLARTMPVPGNGYLVDLSALPRIEEPVVTELRALGVRAAAAGAALTVLARPGQLLGELHEVPVFRVRRPPGITVLAGHLEYLLGASEQRVWTTWGAVQDKMRDAAPADAVRLARIAYQSRPTDSRTCTETWTRNALSAYGDWRGELDGWFAEHRGDTAAAWDRIVLITTAMLEGREASEVFTAADALARILDVRPGDVGGLSGLGVDPSLEVVGARRTRDRGVCFTRPEYADAVLEYVWEQLPRLRGHLVTWTGDLIAEGSPQLAAQIWRACERLALLRGDQALTVTFFDHWTQDGRTRQAAVDFAATVAESPDFGRAIRRRLYDIAKKPSSDHQAVAVARVCALYGLSNPVSALVRLKWLAQAESERARQAALDAVETLAGEAERWFDVVEAVLDGWCHEGVPARRRQVAFRFLVRALAGSEDGAPEMLVWLRTYGDGDRAADRVADMWGTVLDQGDEALAQDAVGTWVSCVLEDASRFEDVANVLVRAVNGGDGLLSEERKNRRTVTAGRMIVLWCERNGVDFRNSAVHALQARLYGARGSAAAG
ncbi:hypothetical protein [Nocardiopsis sp. FR4]|uniref:hypothetical protein n=1 Tax=Nocardiopsis sp. FR4 TaxID=2605985 RepID=UPI00135A454A|nr:hypothetical protein [Nocardiopsis sp. FR4]